MLDLLLVVLIVAEWVLAAVLGAWQGRMEAAQRAGASS